MLEGCRISETESPSFLSHFRHQFPHARFRAGQDQALARARFFTPWEILNRRAARVTGAIRSSFVLKGPISEA